jgi:uncharacterized protein
MGPRRRLPNIRRFERTQRKDRKQIGVIVRENDYLEEIERWRAARLKRLAGPEGWLTLIGLWWLHEGVNSIGSGLSSEVRLPAGKAPAHIGSIQVANMKATAEFDPESGVTCEGQPVSTLELHDDTDNRPTILRMGSMSFFVIRREDELAVRVRDSESESRHEFRGIEHYKVDPSWRIETRFRSYDPPRQARAQTVLGTQETYVVPGAVEFEIGVKTYALDVFLEDPDDDLFVIFGDLTNRSETFGGGRYIYTPQAGQDGTVLLDFNKAYNPPCVFTPYATCPLPLPQNRLPVRIEAGEKRY